MLRVKVFDEGHEKDLEDAMNSFFIDNPNIIISDIKFSVAITSSNDDQIYCFSSMVIYRDVEEY